MILTAEITEVQARTAVDHYLATVLGPTYKAGRAHLRADGRWSFVVLCQRADMQRIPAVGFISVEAGTGQVEALSDDCLRDMREAGAVQAAHERRELARDEDGYVLRRQARIKANAWCSDHIGVKVGASGGVFIPSNPPLWRFSIDFTLTDLHVDQLGLIDVDAQTGQVLPLTDAQLQAIQGDVSAALRSHP